jgi:hypothetical protein
MREVAGLVVICRAEIAANTSAAARAEVGSDY